LSCLPECFDDADRVLPSVESGDLRHQGAIDGNFVVAQEFTYFPVR
jgi:hypothetical protein